MADNTINTVFTATDKVTPTVNKLKTNISKLGTKNTGPLGGMLSGMTGITAGAIGGAAAFALLQDGLQTAGVFLGNAANAAITDQKSILTLNQALKDNVPAWDGSTAAIDRATQAGLNLGFADDVSREALQKLIIATGDVEQSTSDLALAFDIARGTGKDLTTVAGDLAKVEAGSFKSLKSYGIEVSKSMTVTEALGELQKRFSGQAATYTTTLAGRLEVTNTKFEEIQETIGYQVLPVIEDAVTWFDNLADSIGNVGKDMANIGGPGQTFEMHKLTHAVEDTGRTAGADLAENLLDEYKTKMAAARAVFKSSAQDIDGDLAAGIRGNKGVVKDAMDAVMWAIKHPMALTKQLAKIEGALTTLEYKRGLASNTDEVNTVIDQQMAVLRAQWTNLKGEAYPAGAAVSNRFAAGLSTFNMPGIFKGLGIFRSSTPSNHAAGGEIGSGGWSMVGERGPELIRAGRHGATVSPNVGGGPIIVNVDGRELFRIMDERLGKRLAMTSSNAYTRG